MAKVSYNKLQLTKNLDTNSFEWNGQTVEVLKYLPVDDKTQLFERILESATDENGYYNITKINFWMDLEIVFTYTNINFTDKQKEDLFKLYDTLKGSGFLTKVMETMEQEELIEVRETVWGTIQNIYNYSNSALGIMKAITTNYEDLNLDATEITKNLQNPENLTLVKDILTKLG